MEEIEYNFKKHEAPFGTDCNVASVIKRDLFVATDKDIFNKEGFLVVQDEEWSEFQLFRVPFEGKFSDNKKGDMITTNIRYGCGDKFLGMQYSNEGLKKKLILLPDEKPSKIRAFTPCSWM